MRLNTRVTALEKRSGVNKARMHIICVHPDDWEGDLGPGCCRESEIGDYSAKTGPNDYVLCIHDILICGGSEQLRDAVEKADATK